MLFPDKVLALFLLLMLLLMEPADGFSSESSAWMAVVGSDAAAAFVVAVGGEGGWLLLLTSRRFIKRPDGGVKRGGRSVSFQTPSFRVVSIVRRGRRMGSGVSFPSIDSIGDWLAGWWRIPSLPGAVLNRIEI